MTFLVSYSNGHGKNFRAIVALIYLSDRDSDVSLVGWGDTSNVIASVPLQKDVWYQYSITYDGNISKIYRNGEL